MQKHKQAGKDFLEVETFGGTASTVFRRPVLPNESGIVLRCALAEG